MSVTEMDQPNEMPVVVYGENGEVIAPPKPSQLPYLTHDAHTSTSTIRTLPLPHKTNTLLGAECSEISRTS